MARVLVADDDADIRHLVSFALSDEGHEISIARDGVEAFERVSADPPDLMVLDIMMPNKDGYGVLQDMNDSGIRDVTKVLMLTAKASEHDWEKGYELGADQYMTKPFDPDDLVKAVRELLASTKEQLASQREEEYDRARLLSQLESIFGPE